MLKDLNYIKHFPVDKKYIALYAEQNEQAVKMKMQIRDEIDKEVRNKQVNFKIKRGGKKEEKELDDPFLT